MLLLILYHTIIVVFIIINDDVVDIHFGQQPALPSARDSLLQQPNSLSLLPKTIRPHHPISGCINDSGE